MIPQGQTQSERDLPLPGKRRSLHLPITLSVALMSLNVVLMVCWIVLLAQESYYGSMTLGIVAFALILVGLSIYLALTIKEVRLNRRQSNFVGSVTHELKSPIATMRLYLETLQMRPIDESHREQFLGVMKAELERLDLLISQLLEVGRLDQLGADTEPEEINLREVLADCARLVTDRHDLSFDDVFAFEGEEPTLHSRRILIETVFRNLFDNAIKYGGDPPRVTIRITQTRSRVVVHVSDNGDGIDASERGKIFRIFYRSGDELHRRKTGTGLGLYIARTLTHSLKGRISVSSKENERGSVFEVDLPAERAA